MIWSEEYLQDVLDELRERRGDTTSIEVKRASGGVPQLGETLCAFANMPAGGTIILGIDEQGGAFTITGTDDEAALEAGITSQARLSVSPSPQLTSQTVTVEGKRVLLVHVAPLPITERPARFGGSAYLRQSDGDYRIQDHELRMLEVARLHTEEQVSYDLTPAIGLTVEDLDPDLVRSYLATARERDRRLRERTDEEILRRTSVITAQGEPTLAGLYALGDYPQGRYPGLTVTAAVQLRGGEGQPRTRNLQDFTGPLPVLLDDLLGWALTNLDTIAGYRADGHMDTVTELPMNAVRELLANALVHRDLGPNTLGMGKGVQVRLTPRALFIQSPGGLRGVALDQLESEEHAQAAVNQRLYQMAKKLRTADGASIIEGEGGGIREVFRSTADRGLPRPQLIDTGVQFKALLWRPERDVMVGPVQFPLPSAQRTEDLVTRIVDEVPAPFQTRNGGQVWAVLKKAGPLSFRELQERTALSPAQLRWALREPLLDGIVTMEGGQGDRTTRYRLTPPDVRGPRDGV